MPVDDDGDTNATGRSSNPQAEHRIVRTVTLVRILIGTRMVRLTVTASYPSLALAATGRCRLPSSRHD